jgi:hypothetical protein
MEKEIKKLARDRKFIGTPYYQGRAYFWNHEYRHFLRDCTNSDRKKVHDLFLRQGLDLASESLAHELILKNVFKKIMGG